jgi:O-antigen biosynthesis protein
VKKLIYSIFNKCAPAGSKRRDSIKATTEKLRDMGVLGFPFEDMENVPTSTAPQVSIIIPVHNKIRWTLMCLNSLKESGDSTPYEIIVVDDASTDSTNKRLSRIDGINVLRLEKNVGFLYACNKGLEKAQGEFVVYLNNDTEVCPGWLDALMSNFEDETVGLVGSKLVYPDGRLQEAGGIVFSDASGWNYGRFDHPMSSLYTYRREVDYVSGAAIAVRKSILDTTGGFDERYAPAYYEDTDLAFEVRRQGFKVIYEPSSVVIHHEGISHGTDLSSGMKAYQGANKQKFFEKWRAELSHHDGPEASNVTRSARRINREKGTILVLDSYPTWNHDSGSNRLFEILKSFRRRGYNVTLIPELHHRMPQYDQVLSDLGIQVWHSTPSEAQIFVKETSEDVVLVFAARPNNMERFLTMFAEFVPHAPLVFDTVDLHFLRNERAIELSDQNVAGHARFRHLQEKERELRLMEIADMTLVVSEFEKALLETLVTDSRVELLSNIHPKKTSQFSGGNREGLLFVANFNHPPNIDGINWFLNEVYPIIQEKLGDIPVRIVGSPKPDWILEKNLSSVEILGWVEDLDPIYDQSKVVIAPLRYGAGVKGKIGEAWNHGVPVVMTSTGAEGMRALHSENAMIADNAHQFAENVILLLEDDEIWQRISENAQEHVEKMFGLGSTENSLDIILDMKNLLF